MSTRIVAAITNAGAPGFWALCATMFLGTRLALVAIAPESIGDASWYFHRGDGIASGLGYTEGGLPTAFWPVGYPGFLGLVFTIAGGSEASALFANLVVSSASLALTVLLAQLFFQCETTNRLTAILLTLYPNHAAYTAILLTEVFFTFVLLAGCWLYAATRSWQGALAAGIAFGGATLTKTQAIAVPVMLALLELLAVAGPQHRGRALLRAALLVAGMALVLAPWLVRNERALGEPTLATNGGTNLLYGNNARANGFLSNNAEVDALIGYSVGDQVAADKRGRAHALEWIRSHPAGFLALLPKKIWHLWAVDGEAEWSFYAGSPLYAEFEWLFRAARYANQVVYLGLLSGSLLAMALVLRRKACFPSQWAQLGYWLAAYFTLVSLVTFGHPRFHYPLMPFACIYAAWVVAGLSRPVPQY
jgi:hypothetical protein